jgi:hypothetical protein
MTSEFDEKTPRIETLNCGSPFEIPLSSRCSPHVPAPMPEIHSCSPTKPGPIYPDEEISIQNISLQKQHLEKFIDTIDEIKSDINTLKRRIR